MNLRWWMKEFFIAIIAGVLSLGIFVFLCPNIEASRSEARIAQAYLTVSRLHTDLTRDPQSCPRNLSKLDPWGEPYRVIPLESGDLRVLSYGPNRVTGETSSDHDDIQSDLPGSPIKPIIAQKQRQLLMAIVLSLTAWILLLWSAHRYGSYRGSGSA